MTEDELLNIIKELQKKIEHDEEKTYSKAVIREYRNPTNFGVIKNPNAVGIIKGPCGDTMKITLNIVNSTIQDARFWTDGCGPTLACGNKLLKMIKNRTITDAANISEKHLIKALDGLPKNHSHCAKLSIITLSEAINDYYRRNKNEKL